MPCEVSHFANNNVFFKSSNILIEICGVRLGHID